MRILFLTSSTDEIKTQTFALNEHLQSLFSPNLSIETIAQRSTLQDLDFEEEKQCEKCSDLIDKQCVVNYAEARPEIAGISELVTVVVE